MTFGERGIEVVPRTGKDVSPAWRFAWETIGIGRTGQMQAVEPVSPESEGSRVTYRRDGWSEWYENTAKGLEQGFAIERKPAGEGPLRIMGEFPEALRPEPREDGAIDFIDENGARALRYGELHVLDADGEELASHLTVANHEIALVIDDDGAQYPLMIDPLMTSPSWTAEPDVTALFGHSVATAGDVNGDGYSDVIVGAWVFTNGESNEGRAFVYHGSAAGLSFTPNWTAEGNQVDAFFGYSVATAGDVNGDGFDDVIVGAMQYDNGSTNEGRACVFHGSASGLSATANWTAESDQDFAEIGRSVGTAGDVNGDGFADVIVGCPGFDNGQSGEGRAFVYHGSASGLSLAAHWTAESDQAGAQFGDAVSTAGDVNGDGFADVIVGAWLYTNGQGNEGGAFVYRGSASGLNATPARSAEGDQANANFGKSVAGAGDVNGDGFADVIIGSPGYTNGQSHEGRVWVYHGSATGLTLVWGAESDQASNSFGWSVGTAGDANGDGFADVVVGNKDWTNGQFTEGRAYVYQGSAAGLATTPIWTAESNQASAQYGNSVATAGDVNGDGYSDIIVGAPQYDNGQTDEGRAFTYHGSGAGLAATAAWTGEADQVVAQFGWSVATAGDVNGDGFSDVIVGAPAYDNGQMEEGRLFVYHGSATGLATTAAWTAESDQAGAQFGYSVGTAGDVNGDGISDVIVGAPTYDNGEFDEGRAFVYHGSAEGLLTTPAWTAESDQIDAEFGTSVGTAGDVNGDGFSDVIVGAEGFDNGQSGEGRAFVYWGSAAGLATSPAWTSESDHATAQFGASVATAGDVNGDGFSDVIVGARTYDNGQSNEGRAFAYHGSPVGLATSPAWTAESDQASAFFGISVGTAGDVNGDGFSDVIVGAIGYDNGQDGEGRAFVYLGSFAGLVLFPDVEVESNQIAASFGISVGTAGDVNGDGFSDVVVGARLYNNGQADEGRAFVYHGSATGLEFAAAWTAESNQAGARFGSSVATAGDVNGDGFSDVIVGAYQYANGEVDEGLAFAYYGNEGDGLDRIARQARTDDSAPIALLGPSDSPTSFRLKALGRTAAGRGQVRLQIEVKPFGVAFDGSGLGTGAIFDTGAPSQGIGSAVPLSELASGLTAETLYHWRLRIAADSPFFPRSPWLTLAGNALTEADLRTASPPTGIANEDAPAARDPQLDPVRPNPLRAHGEIAYTLPEAGRVRLAAYDVTGRQVAVLSDGAQEGGRHALRWDGRDAGGHALPAGVYLFRLETAGRVTSQKVVIAR
jgi:hypothetical protein